MTANLENVKVAVLAADGFEQSEMVQPRNALNQAGAKTVLVSLKPGEVRGWNASRADTDAAAVLTVETFPDAGLDLETQKLQARRQVPLMFSDLTQANGFGWWSEETVAQNIETLALLGRSVTPDLWDRSILEEIHG